MMLCVAELVLCVCMVRGEDGAHAQCHRSWGRGRSDGAAVAVVVAGILQRRFFLGTWCRREVALDTYGNVDITHTRAHTPKCEQKRLDSWQLCEFFSFFLSY